MNAIGRGNLVSGDRNGVAVGISGLTEPWIRYPAIRGVYQAESTAIDKLDDHIEVGFETGRDSQAAAVTFDRCLALNILLRRDPMLWILPTLLFCT